MPNSIKVIQFIPLDYQNDTYNLSIGDLNMEAQKIDFDSKSGNHDIEKIFFTIGKAIEIFLKLYPNAKIVVFGSTESRNRIYRMAINKHFEKIKKKYHISGLRRKHWEYFKKDGSYVGFLIMQK